MLQRYPGTFAALNPARWLRAASRYLPCSALLGAIVASSTAITGATEADTAFDKAVTIPADTLVANTVLRIRAQGVHTATTGAETHTIALKIGTTTIASRAAVDPANNDIFTFDITVTIRTAGASGTMVAAGTMAVGAGGTANPIAVLLASTAIDTTAAKDVAVWIDRQAAATDGDSARLDLLVVEIIG